MTFAEVSGVVIEGCRFTRLGASGLGVSGGDGLTVRGCDFDTLSAGAIVVSGSRATTIEDNRVRRVGLEYSGSPGISVTGTRGCVIKDTRTPYNFGLYTDYGASWVTVEENVVMRADNTAVLHVGPPLENVVYRGNFWDADPLGHDDPPAGVTYEGNATIKDERELNAATAGIQARTGLLRT
ncbi:right-handed parallel beta-helix repeat-containing protein [Nonomuraea sp. NPDC049709]|uniref:right-handed parallel beta-helix repeat-containing protein n=1 Tax=Nonomuraea sp. NPDC049709 TaxID=3154736 RepID=UPI00342BE936